MKVLTSTILLFCFFIPSQSTVSLISKSTPTKDRKLDIDDVINDPFNSNVERFRLKLEGINRELETYQEMMRNGKSDNFEMMDKAITILSQKANLSPADMFLKKHFEEQEGGGEEADEERKLKKLLKHKMVI